MDKCHLGERNAEDIQKIFEHWERTNTKILIIEKNQVGMQSDLTHIREMLEVKHEHMEQKVESNEENLKSHLQNSEQRLKDIDLNTLFRKIGVWVAASVVGRMIYELVGMVKNAIK